MQDRHRQFDEIFLQRTAGPYIRVKIGSGAARMACPFYPHEPTSSHDSDMSVWCQKATSDAYSNERIFPLATARACATFLDRRTGY
jgi:hypothetical protein